MKYLLTILVLVLTGFQLYSQSTDTLLVGSDTIVCQIMVKQVKTEYQVFFKNSINVEWNEVYPEYANAAFSAIFRYISVKLPDTENKVWAKCYLNGTYQLLEYKRQYYVVGPENINKLTSVKEKLDMMKTTQQTLFIGQMIVIFGNQIDHNYSKLKYNSKSLVQPIIKYHEARKLPFHDYNDYSPAKINVAVGLTGVIETVRLNLQPDEDFYGTTFPVDFNEFYPAISINLNLTIPKLSKNLYFTGGLEFSKHKIDAVGKYSTSEPVIYYANLQYDERSFAIPVTVGYEFLKSKKAVIALQTGIKPFKNVISDAELRLEKEENNVVNTSFITVNKHQKVQLYYNLGIKFYSPSISKRISIGVNYDYSITPEAENTNSISNKDALTFSAAFNF
jgi:hypothetical protein